MITTYDIETELDNRIQTSLEHTKEVSAEQLAIAWGAYCAGLLEWDVIDLATFKKCVHMLPQIANPNPVETILLGREDGCVYEIGN